MRPFSIQWVKEVWHVRHFHWRNFKNKLTLPSIWERGNLEFKWKTKACKMLVGALIRTWNVRAIWSVSLNNMNERVVLMKSRIRQKEILAINPVTAAHRYFRSNLSQLILKSLTPRYLRISIKTNRSPLKKYNVCTENRSFVTFVSLSHTSYPHLHLGWRSIISIVGPWDLEIAVSAISWLSSSY